MKRIFLALFTTAFFFSRKYMALRSRTRGFLGFAKPVGHTNSHNILQHIVIDKSHKSKFSNPNYAYQLRQNTNRKTSDLEFHCVTQTCNVKAKIYKILLEIQIQMNYELQSNTPSLFI